LSAFFVLKEINSFTVFRELDMNVKQAYNNWAEQYDTNENKTRDMEAHVLKSVLEFIPIGNCLEIGCGTGKNTPWLAEKSKSVTAVDFSEEMIAIAKSKIIAANVEFKQADITLNWDFAKSAYDLITFSLVLEHISNLDFVFSEAWKVLNTGGHVYIGELHPFKQYTGSKARFNTEAGLQIVDCFTHHVSDFVQTAKRYGLRLMDVNEYFDDDNKGNIPRILSILLTKA